MPLCPGIGAIGSPWSAVQPAQSRCSTILENSSTLAPLFLSAFSARGRRPRHHRCGVVGPAAPGGAVLLCAGGRGRAHQRHSSRAEDSQPWCAHRCVPTNDQLLHVRVHEGRARAHGGVHVRGHPVRGHGRRRRGTDPRIQTTCHRIQQPLAAPHTLLHLKCDVFVRPGGQDGAITYGMCRDLVDEWVLVSERQIAEAMRLYRAMFGKVRPRPIGSPYLYCLPRTMHFYRLARCTTRHEALR